MYGGTAEMVREVVGNIVREVVAMQASKYVGLLKDDTKLADLEIASLDVLEIVFRIEERFGVDIIASRLEEEATGGFDTIGEVVDVITKMVDDRSFL